MSDPTIKIVGTVSMLAEPPPQQQEQDWYVANQKYLSAAVDVLRNRLECYAAPAENQPELQSQGVDRKQTFEAAAAALRSPSALDRLCQLFNLSNFDRDILLLCVAIVFHVDFASLLAAAQGNAQSNHPTFGLALAVLPKPD